MTTQFQLRPSVDGYLSAAMAGAAVLAGLVATDGAAAPSRAGTSTNTQTESGVAYMPLCLALAPHEDFAPTAPGTAWPTVQPTAITATQATPATGTPATPTLTPTAPATGTPGRPPPATSIPPTPTATATTAPPETPPTPGTSPPRTPTTPPPTATASPAPPVNECSTMPRDWVFCDDFEQGRTWDGSVSEPAVIEHPGPSGAAGNRVAQLRVPPGRGGYGLWKQLPESDRLYARWYVQWEPGHDISARHHGPGGMGADISWYTGRSGIRPNGDEYFVSTLEPSTVSPYNIFAYTYYRGMFMDCADPNGRCWGDHFPCDVGPRYCTRPEYLPKVEQPGTVTGRWYCLEQMIDAGAPVRDRALADGQLDFWIDGLEIGPWTDLWWRIVPTLKVNFLWLFLFHHDDSHTIEGILIDNVVVGRSQVGCAR